MEEKLETSIFFTKIMCVVFSYFNYIMKTKSKHLTHMYNYDKVTQFFSPLFIIQKNVRCKRIWIFIFFVNSYVFEEVCLLALNTTNLKNNWFYFFQTNILKLNGTFFKKNYLKNWNWNLKLEVSSRRRVVPIWRNKRKTRRNVRKRRSQNSKTKKGPRINKKVPGEILMSKETRW